MTYPEHAGYLPLREAIAAYLAVARGILCDSP
jgi:DNA-binding transcriptional MocR family regulator